MEAITETVSLFIFCLQINFVFFKVLLWNSQLITNFVNGLRKDFLIWETESRTRRQAWGCEQLERLFLVRTIESVVCVCVCHYGTIVDRPTSSITPGVSLERFRFHGRNVKAITQIWLITLITRTSDIFLYRFHGKNSSENTRAVRTFRFDF